MSFQIPHATLSEMSRTNKEKLSSIPSVSSERIGIKISASAEHAIKNNHPWLFARGIKHQNKEGKPGDLAVIFAKDRKFLAIGLYDPISPIRVRILAHHIPVPINEEFFHNRINTAFKIRERLTKNTTGYRIIHGGNDKLPGLVVDRYADTFVIKLYSTAWLPHLKGILSGLESITGCQRIVLRLSRKLIKTPEFLYQLNDGDILSGPPISSPVIFQENGLWFEIDPLEGHKTGFYLDQRENRAKVKSLANGKKILNVFSYTGGFSIYAASGGAKVVTSVDISQQALNAAIKNFCLNSDHPLIRISKHKTIKGDAFKILAELRGKNKLYDMVIIDPPSFAKDQAQVRKAISAYQRLTRLGLNLLRKGGILVQSSCSSRVTANDFFTAVYHGAKESGYILKEIERSNHPMDHPIRFKESAYLKCLFASVK